MIGILAAVLGTVVLLGGGRAKASPEPAIDRSAPPERWSRLGLTGELTPWGEGWRWRVWWDYAGPGQTLAEGWAATTEAAKASADAWIDSSADGSGISLGTQIRRGLRVSDDCTSIVVVRVDEWIAWAAPRMPAPEDPVDPAEFLRALFGELYPECEFAEPSIRGMPWDRAVEQFAGALERAAAGSLLDVAETEEVLAARAVGLSAPKRQGAAEWYSLHGHPWAIVVDLHPTGTGWRWRVWMDRREGEPLVERAATSREVALGSARAWVEGRNAE